MYLGFDLGTTNVKAVAVDDDRRVAATGSAPVERFTTPDGGVEQEIEQIWAATCAAIGQAIAAVDPSAIRAVGVSSQGGALQLLDDRQKPLGRVISWLDGRGRPFDEEITRQLGRDFLAEHIGHAASAMTIGQILRLRAQSPELMRKARHIAFVGDAIVGRLCGRRAHDPTSLSIAMLYNPWQRRADPELLKWLGIEEAQLPRLLPITTPAGTIHQAASRQTGLPAGIPVSPAMHDQYAVSLGAGSVREGDITFGAGTAWVLLANGARLTRPICPDAFVCPHPVAGLFGQMLSLRNGGSAIQWALELIGREKAPTKAVDRLLSEAPPGCDGLQAWPLLATEGGRIEGLTLAHGPAHLLRAVVEGLACELACHLKMLDEAGLPVKRLTMCGSAAASRVTPRILADATGRPVACVDAFDLSALGAAAAARAMAEGDADFSQLTAGPPGGKTFQPGKNAPRYQPLLARYIEHFGQRP